MNEFVAAPTVKNWRITRKCAYITSAVCFPMTLVTHLHHIYRQNIVKNRENTEGNKGNCRRNVENVGEMLEILACVDVVIRSVFVPPVNHLFQATDVS